MDRVRGWVRWPPVWIAGALVAVLLAVAPRYGWHRDELYFLQCGKRLAWGYVDQPPLTPAIARLSFELFGTNLVGLRLFPALALGTVIVLMALTARELGGGRWAEVVAAGCGASAPVFLGLGHILATATIDLLAWTVITYLVVRLLRTGNQRLWLAIGAAAGLGLLNKHMVLFVMFGVVVGLLFGPSGRRQFAGPWPWAGGVLALLIWAPNLAWQAQHDWPVSDMLRSLHGEPETIEMVVFLPTTALFLGGLVVVWVPGLRHLLRDERFRPLGVAFAALVAVFIVGRGKPYYLAGIFPVVLAAGAVWWERRAVRRRVVGWIVGTAIIGLPLAVPIVPMDLARYHPIEDVALEFGAQLGWPQLVDRVAAARRTVSDDAVTILAGNYGEAEALNLYGPSRRLPRAYSGHNNEWLWGPPRSETPVTITIGFGPGRLAEMFSDCRLVDTLAEPHHVASEEEGAPIAICTGQRAPWSVLWPHLKVYSA